MTRHTGPSGSDNSMNGAQMTTQVVDTDSVVLTEARAALVTADAALQEA